MNNKINLGINQTGSPQFPEARTVVKERSNTCIPASRLKEDVCEISTKKLNTRIKAAKEYQIKNNAMAGGFIGGILAPAILFTAASISTGGAVLIGLAIGAAAGGLYGYFNGKEEENALNTDPNYKTQFEKARDNAMLNR